MKTMVIAGAGRNLGYSLAKRFGKEGFSIVLIARNKQKLADMAKDLADEGVQAEGFAADLRDPEAVSACFEKIKAKYEQIDVLEFSPLSWDIAPSSVLEMKPSSVLYQFESQVMAAIYVVNEVWPDMVQRGEGALLFTTGLSAFQPIPALGDMGIAMAGLRNYITNLNTELTPKGILVAHRSIAVPILKGDNPAGDPDVIADMWYQIYKDRQAGEAAYPGLPQA